MGNNYTDQLLAPAASQLFQLGKGFENGIYNTSDLGSMVPASLMVHDLENMRPVGVGYMNDWGCERLGTSADDINLLGMEYYDRYFVREEIQKFFAEIDQFLMAADFDRQYSFFQRVKIHHYNEFRWFYSVCKLIRLKTSQGVAKKMIMLSSPVEGVDLVMSKVNRILEEDAYVKKSYHRFALLSPREKEIITLMTNGKSSKEIAEQLCVSVHTIHTHRKNISRKTECATFACLLKFAMAFDLV